MPSPRDLITGNLELVSLPEIILRLNEMVENPQCSATEIAAIIQNDTSLSARLLKIANSPYYSLPSQVDSISLAITIIGTRQLKDMILATTIINHFNSLPGGVIPISQFWKHSIACATACNVIARKLQTSHHERFFLAGLLHDIGKLVLFITMPDESRKLIARCAEQGAELSSLEKDIFQFDHSEVGAELLKQWNLPESLVISTQYHHHPGETETYQQETAAVHLGNAIANTLKPFVSEDDDMPVIPDVWNYLGLPETMLDEIIDETSQGIKQIFEIFYPGAA